MAKEFVDNPELIKDLAEGEKIVWRGRPETFSLMSAEMSKPLTRRWLCCIVAAVVLVALYIVLTVANGLHLNAWLLVLGLVVVAYVAALPAMDRNNILKKCKYYITDRRVILYYGDRDIFSLPRTGLKYARTEAEAGCVHLELGSCVGVKGKKRRVAAFIPKKDDNDNVCGLVLYNVADSDVLKSLFS